MTNTLNKNTYWGSFNVPYFDQTRKNLGYEQIVNKFHPEAVEFGYSTNPRGK